MAYSIKKEELINYPPETLRTFIRTGYEWIDNLNFTLRPADCLSNAEPYIEIAKEIFLEEGWYGDGEIELMWIPPFMLPYTGTRESFLGIVIWHVKQEEDGISWILSPIELPR